jgi:hypothetical protein
MQDSAHGICDNLSNAALRSPCRRRSVEARGCGRPLVHRSLMSAGKRWRLLLHYVAPALVTTYLSSLTIPFRLTKRLLAILGCRHLHLILYLSLAVWLWISVKDKTSRVRRVLSGRSSPAPRLCLAASAYSHVLSRLDPSFHVATL